MKKNPRYQPNRDISSNFLSNKWLVSQWIISQVPHYINKKPPSKEIVVSPQDYFIVLVYHNNADLYASMPPVSSDIKKYSVHNIFSYQMECIAQPSRQVTSCWHCFVHSMMPSWHHQKHDRNITPTFTW